jgi:TRAP transporter TAXI family solute receptor
VANHTIGEALAGEYAGASSPRRVELIYSANGAVDTVNAIQKGLTDFGISLADVAYLAFAGQLDGVEPFPQLRGVAVLDLVPVHLLVRRDAQIAGLPDLRGRVVNVGPIGSEARVIAGFVLEAFGLSAEQVHTRSLPFPTALAQLGTGELDAMFLTVTAPAELVTSAVAAGARLLPIEGPLVRGLRREYPFLQLAQVQGGIYASHPEPTRTIGVEKVLLCRSDLSEDLVHEFTRRLFDVLPRVSASLGAGRFTAVEYSSATPVPLHPGSARYYRERELSR